jgi:predicted enzyme related to lactoylglutathione lyase
MGERTQYTPGTFSWVDLGTTDQEGAKRFYGELFGWEYTDSPIGDDQVYSMASLGGRHVAAIAPQPPAQREAGAGPVWNSYITVQSADDAMAEARELGAHIHAPAFDVFDAGRMGVVQDPHGAYFLVWEPRNHPGAGLVNAPGALSWNELATPDVEGAAEFYSKQFGWSTEAMEGGSPYLVVMNRDGRANGGIRKAASTEPSYWLAYFGADDLDGTLARARDLGGTQLIDPMDAGPGRVVALQDPQGAVFALYAGQFDD